MNVIPGGTDRKIIIPIFALAVLLALVCSVAGSENADATDGDITWTLDGNTLTVSGSGPMTSVPNGIDFSNVTKVVICDGVTSVKNYAFANRSSLTSVIIPNSVTTIGTSAFAGCSSLNNVSLGNGVASIGNFAFSGCVALGSISIPDSVKSIGDFIFGGCDSLTNVTVSNTAYVNHFDRSLLTTVTISNTASEIVPGAFENCVKLTSIEIPDGVTTIGNDAFKGCVALKTVTIGKDVESIGDQAFSGCVEFTSVQIPEKVTSVGNHAFNGCVKLAAVGIPDGVTKIGAYTFNGCVSLTSVEIPDGVAKIESSVFRDCSALKTVTVGNGAESIGSYAFKGCVSLASVTIPDGVANIGENAFFGCLSLTEITIPNTKFIDCFDRILLKSVTVSDAATAIGDYAFNGLDKLETVEIGSNVKSIGSHAFFGCDSLTSVEIPGCVTSIGENAFSKCVSLTEITVTNTSHISHFNLFKLVSVILSDKTKSVDTGAFNGFALLTSIKVSENNPRYSSINGVLYSKDGTTLVKCPPGIGTSYTVSGNVKNIGNGAFDGCALLTSVIIPDSVENIGENAFGRCDSLTKVTVSDTEHIRFLNPSKLVSITLSDNAKSIDIDAFDGCVSLKSINVSDSSENYSSIGGVLYNKDGTSLIKCPSAIGSVFTIPDNVTSIGNGAFKGCLSLARIEVSPNNGNFVSENGVLFDSGKTTLILYPSAKEGSSYRIPDSAISIGDYAFDGCTNLKAVTVGKDVGFDKNLAFYDCGSVTVNIYDNDANELRIAFGKNADGEYSATVSIPDSADSVGILFESPLTDDETKLLVSPEAYANLFSGDGTVVFNAVDVSSSVDASIKQIIGENAAVFDLSLSVNGAQKHRFGGKVTVTLPYALKEGETAENIKVYYINAEWEIIPIEERTYSEGCVTFETDHFSQFAISSKTPVPPTPPSGGNVNPEPPSDGGTGTTTLIIVAAVAIAVVFGIICLVIFIKR